MRSVAPAIDAHAHVETGVSAQDMASLNACVLAVTRRPAEWPEAIARQDDLAVWGIGVHPADDQALHGFDSAEFALALERAQLVGEVGLDGRAGSIERQREVLRAVLRAVAENPRPVSIHSTRSTQATLDALSATPVPSPILHWWRGSEAETKTAIELGCFFSLNGAEASNPKVVSLLPSNRVLTETDFPHTRGRDPAAAMPGRVSTIEAALETAWSVDQYTLRRTLWANLADLFDRCGRLEHVPPGIQDVVLSIGAL